MSSTLSDAAKNVEQLVVSVLKPPSGETARNIQHAVCVCLAAYAAKTAFQLGPKGVAKAVLTKLLPALELVPGKKSVSAQVEQQPTFLLQVLETWLQQKKPRPLRALSRRCWAMAMQTP